MFKPKRTAPAFIARTPSHHRLRDFPVLHHLTTVARLTAVFSLLILPLFFLTRGHTPVYAATSDNLNFQARLEGGTGAIAPDGNYNVEFKLYDASSGGTLLWTETRTGANKVRVANGYLTVNLGDVTAFSSTMPWDQQLYLTMNIGGTGSPSWDGEMSPRLKLTAVPYAFNAKTASQLVTTSGALSSTLSLQAPTVGNQVFVVPDQGAAGTYNILTAPSGSDGYIKLQGSTPGTQQTGNFNISGTGIAATLQGTTSLLTPTVDTASGVPLNIGTSGSPVATAINLNQSTVLAAGKSIAITGGNTASRPASPTEGMIYYDTTNHQLLVYANGKWQADRSTATKIVGTSAVGGASTAVASAGYDGADYLNTSTTNAETQIQAAINSLPATGGTVYLMEGTYILGAGLTIPNNVTITGAGAATILKFANSSNLSVGMLRNSDTSTGNHITIQNLKLDGNQANNTGNAQGILLNGVGASGSPAVGAHITNVWVENFTDTGIYITASARIVITGVTVQGNTNNGVSLTGTTYSTITGNLFSDNTTSTATGLLLGASSNYNTISGNTMSSNGNNGITIGGGSSWNNIANNTVAANASSGISLTSSTGNTVNNTVSGNVVTGNANTGIRINNSSNNLFTSNTVDNNGGSGGNDAILLTGNSLSNQVTNNKITDTAGTSYAINIVAGSNTNTIGNNLIGTGANGVWNGGVAIQDAGTGTIWQNQTDANGNLRNSTAASSGYFYNSSTSAPTIVSRLQTGSTQDLFQAQDGAGTTVLMRITSTGALQAPSLDTTSTSTTLSIGTGNATIINMGSATNATNAVSITAGSTGGISLLSDKITVGTATAATTIQKTTQTSAATAGAQLNVVGATGNTSGAGGIAKVIGGTGGTTGAGGDLQLYGGAAGGGNTNGGNVTLQGGALAGSGANGAVNINASFNAATNINTGTSTGTVTIGNLATAANAVNIAAGSTGGINLQSALINVGTATVAPTIQGVTQTSAATPGVQLSILGATGNTSGAGGIVAVTGGTGGTTGAGGALNLTGGTGGATSGTGGAVTVQGGTAVGAFAGGLTTVQGGTAAATAGSNGGAVAITGATGSATGTGGTGGGITLTAGSAAGSAANAGGNIQITAGAATSTGAAGTISITSGNSPNGTAGTVTIDTGTSTSGTSNISIGTTNAGSVTIGRATTTTTIQGSTSVTPQASTSTTLLCTNSGVISTCDASVLAPTTANFIQAQAATPGTAQNKNFNLGTGVGLATTFQGTTSLITPTLDTASAVALNIGVTSSVINLNQSTSLAAGKNFTFTAGAGNFDQSASTGTFDTGTGVVRLNGDTTVATGKNFTVTSGTTSITGTTNVNTSGAAATSIGTGTGNNSVGNTTGTLGLTGSTVTVLGNTSVNTTGSGTTTIGSNAGGAVSISANAASSFTTNTGALTLTSAAATTWSTAAGALTLQGAAGVTINTANTTVSSGVTIQSGNSSAGTAGTVTIDTGTSTSGTSNISIGTTNAGSVTIGKAAGTSPISLSASTINLGIATTATTLQGVTQTSAATAGAQLNVVGATGNTSGAGGIAKVIGGTGGTTGAGGDLQLYGGAAGGGNTNGGNVTLQGGALAGSGANGAVNINASFNAATNINTGTSTGTVTIGNLATAANAVNIAAGSTGGINLQSALINVGTATVAPTIQGVTQTSAATPGVQLSILGATGNTSGAGGIVAVTGGTGGTTGAGGALNLTGGTGGATSGTGGAVTVQGGTAVGAFAGGLTTVQGGTAAATAGSNGGAVAITGAIGSATGTGGTGGGIQLTAGNAQGSAANAGGNISLTAGNSTTTAGGGAITILSGNSATGTAGTVRIDTGTGSTVGTINIGDTNAGTINIGRAAGTAINLLTNTTLATGKTITVNGDTRTNISGIASPTEGMITYDTTNHQLLVYANAKWQADRSTATKIVGTSASGSGAVASQAPDAADYVNASTTSAQTVINTALTAVGTAGGGTVYLMEGTYIVDGVISVPSNVTLAGSGSGTIIKNKAAYNNSTGMIQNSDQTVGNDHITIQNLKLDGNKSGQSSGAGMGIYFKKVGTGSTIGAHLTNIWAENFKDAGIMFEASTRSTLTGVSAHSNDNDGLVINSSSYITVTGGVFSDNTSGSSPGVLISNGSSYNTVSGNVIANNVGVGVNMTGSSTGNTITGNDIYNNSSNGINIQNSNGNTISNNLVSTSGANGIRLSTAVNNLITGNSVSDSGGTDAIILVTTSTNNLISNNKLTDAAGTGRAINIDATSATNTLSANLIGAGTYGVWNGAGAIADGGTGTIYQNQTDSSGNLRNSTGKTSGFFQSNDGTNNTDPTLIAKVQGSSTADLFQAQNSSGTALFKVSSAGIVTYVASGTAGSNLVCQNASSQLAACSSTYLSTTTGIQNQNASAQTSANFWIDGTGKAAVLSASTNISTPAIRPIADSTTALQIQNAAGTTTAITVDTTNNYVGIGSSSAPTTKLDVITNDSLTNNLPVRIYQGGVGDSGVQIANAAQDYVVGIDSSDGNSFKINSSTAAGGNSTAGYGTVGGNTDSADYNALLYEAMTPSISGTVSQVRAYVGSVGTTPKAVMGIYSDSFGHPGALVASSSELNLTANSWNTFTLTSGYAVTSGNQYWLAYSGNGASAGLNTVPFDDPNSGPLVGHMWYSRGAYSSTLPGSGSYTTTSTRYYSLYALVATATPGDQYSASIFTLTSQGAAKFRNATNSTTALQVQTTAGTNVFTVDTTNQRISIGTLGTATGQLYVSGSIPTTYTGTIASGITTAQRVLVQGRYAYVTGTQSGSKVAVFDISNPGSMTALGNYTDATGNAGGQTALAGSMLYIDSGAVVAPVTIANQNAPASGGSTAAITAGSGTGIAVSGKYVYTASSTTLQSYDISSGTPVSQQQLTGLTGNGAIVQTQGAYVYVGSSTNVTVVNAANPASMSIGGTVAYGSAVSDMKIQGRYVYAVSSAGNNMKIYDVKNPAVAPVLAATLSMPASCSPTSIAVQSRFAYIGCSGTANAIQVVDLSTIGTPAITGAISAGVAIKDVFISGRYLYTVDGGQALKTFDLGGAYIQQLEAGGIEASTVNVLGVSMFNGEVNLRSGLQVAKGAEINGGLGVVGGAISLNDSSNFAVNIATGTSTGAVTIGNLVTAANAVNIAAGSTGGINLQSALINVGTATVAPTIQGVTQTSANTAGVALSILGATGNGSGVGGAINITGGTGGGTNAAGGVVTIAGGTGGATNSNGGNLILKGGAGTGTGIMGLVNLNPTIFSAATAQTIGSSGTLTQSFIDSYSTLPIIASATGLTFTVPAPTAAGVSTIGRVFYVSNAGTNDFSIVLAGSSITLTLKANSTATLIWNGNGWTAAGASSSTDLQSAYNNTLTSAGGAELVLNASGGAADGLTIRNNAGSPITGALFEVQSSIGTDMLSVNNNTTEYAVNGGAENSTFTGWSTGTGATVTKNVTTTYIATGQNSISVATSAINQSAKNTLSSALAAGTYLVSFTARLGATPASGTLNAYYSVDGAANTSTCVSTSATSGYTQVTSWALPTAYPSWVKITCLVTVPGGATSSNAIYVRESDMTTGAFYIDNLSVSSNASTNRPANVQIGGGLYGGQPTILTLDQFSAPPMTALDNTFLGSMYYDTTAGSIQCYEADGWGACGSSPDNIITLTPEYTGAVLDGTGVGTMTADICSNAAALTVGTLCASGEARNFYRWTSPQPTAQSYSVYVAYKLPSTFKSFVAGTAGLTSLVDNTSNASVKYAIFKKASAGGVISCSADATMSGTVSTWNSTAPTTDLGTGACTVGGATPFVAGDTVIIRITVTAQSNASAYIENLTFRYANK